MKEIKKYDRINLFNHYQTFDNPFLILTTKIDITNIVNYCKKEGSFYATMGYLITKTVNNIDAFKYRYQNGKIYYYDNLDSNYTNMYADGNIGFYNVDFNDNYKVYINSYKKIYSDFYSKKIKRGDRREDLIWLSCFPWNEFSGLIPPFNKNITIPQFIWDKYHLENNNYYINLMILVHHGFADGSHISKFLIDLKNNIEYFSR